MRLPAQVNDLLPGGVGLVVVLLLVGSAVAVLVRYLPVPYESVLALIGRSPAPRSGVKGFRAPAAS